MKIQKVTDRAFAPYGSVNGGFPCGDILEAM